MIHFLNVDPSDAVPIWKQIEDGVRRLAAAGTVEAGAGVPSVRDLARELRVNPATVAKAYGRLTDAGVLVVRRGEGTFVADRPAREVRAERRHLLGEDARRFAHTAVMLNAERAEATAALNEAFAEVESGESGGAS